MPPMPKWTRPWGACARKKRVTLLSSTTRRRRRVDGSDEARRSLPAHLKRDRHHTTPIPTLKSPRGARRC